MAGVNFRVGRERTRLPAWVSALSAGQWTSLANSNLSSVAPSPTPAGNSGPDAKIDCWNSLIVDTRDSKLYCACNGGHADYSGNEVDVINLAAESPAWSELRAPTATVSNAAFYADGRPSSRHTYYGAHADETNNRLMIFGGSIYSDGGSTGTVASFNLTTNDYNASNTHPDKPLRITTDHGSAAARDPATGDIYFFGDYFATRWNRSSNDWTELIGYPGGAAQWFYCSAAFDSSRNRILILGLASTYLFTLSGSSMTTVTLTGTPAATIRTDTEEALVYVPALDVYLFRSQGAGGTVYQINASTWEVSEFTTSGGASIPASARGIYSKFLYVPNLRGCVYVPTHTGNIWFLRTN